MRVSGIGPAKAQALYENGIKTLEDLRKNQDKLNHNQLIGLKYVEEFEKKIPRSEIKEIEEVLKREIGKLDDKYVITICGSYRRGKLESGDVDVLVTHPEYTSSKNKKVNKEMLKKIVVCLEKCGLMTETISLGDTKFMVIYFCRFSNVTI